MNMFFGLARQMNDCEVMESAFGLIDPEGDKWQFGDTTVVVEYQKCYINSNFK